MTLGFPHLFTELIFFGFGVLPEFMVFFGFCFFFFSKSSYGTVPFSLISVTLISETSVASKVIQTVSFNSRSWKSISVDNKCCFVS